jgi:hypothetical protein
MRRKRRAQVITLKRSIVTYYPSVTVSTQHYLTRSFWRVVTMVNNTRNFWVSGLYPSSGVWRNTTFRKLDLFPSSGKRVGWGGGRRHLLSWAPQKELISISRQLLSDLHNCLNTWDQDNSAGDNNEYTIKIVKNHAHAWNWEGKRGVIFLLQTSNRTECMCTNAMKCGTEKGGFSVETCSNHH